MVKCYTFSLENNSKDRGRFSVSTAKDTEPSRVFPDASPVGEVAPKVTEGFTDPSTPLCSAQDDRLQNTVSFRASLGEPRNPFLPGGKPAPYEVTHRTVPLCQCHCKRKILPRFVLHKPGQFVSCDGFACATILLRILLATVCAYKLSICTKTAHHFLHPRCLTAIFHSAIINIARTNGINQTNK